MNGCKSRTACNTIWKLQLVPDVVAWAVKHTYYVAHVIPPLCSLHWLCNASRCNSRCWWSLGQPFMAWGKFLAEVSLPSWLYPPIGVWQERGHASLGECCWQGQEGDLFLLWHLSFGIPFLWWATRPCRCVFVLDPRVPLRVMEIVPGYGDCCFGCCVIYGVFLFSLVLLFLILLDTQHNVFEIGDHINLIYK